MSALYNENDPYAARWLANLVDGGHIAPGTVSAKSILDLEGRELVGFRQAHFFAGVGVWSAALRASGWPDNRRVWTGSCPCQPFSSAGKGAGFNDERHLWPAWFWLVSQHRPDVIFGEQVEGPAGRAWLDLVFTDLEGIGYSCGATIIPAGGVGAPHRRHRIYWMADAQRRNQRGQRGEPRSETSSRGCETWSPDGNPAGGSSGLGFVANAERNGFHARLTRGRGRQESPWGASGDIVDRRSDQQPRPSDGFWRDPDWIFCRDNKWRPVEPGAFPLAHGASARMGRLRAYGNAIVLQQAQAFIEAFLELEALDL